MITELRKWLIGLVVAVLFALSVVGALGSCNKPVPPSSAKIDTIILERHDTLVKLDTILQEKIKYIKSAPDTFIIKEFERVYVSDPDDTTKVQTTVSAERKALIVKDSLTWCMSCRSVDSVAIDSLTKIGKEKAPESGGLIHDLKVFGSGVLVGAGIRSFF